VTISPAGWLAVLRLLCQNSHPVIRRVRAYLATVMFSFGVLLTPHAHAVDAMDNRVAIGVPTWAGAQAIANVLKVVITQSIGAEVELVPGTNATIFQAMDQGKGGIDVHPDVWLPNQESFTKKYVQDKKTVSLSPNPYVGDQGFCVSKQFSEALKVTDITDLGRPDVAEAMDSDGNGLGELWIGAPGWASANVNQVKVRDYDLSPFIEPIRTEESVKTARIKESISKKEGYAFYCYKPHAVWHLFDITMLSEPDYNPRRYRMLQPSDAPDWYERSTVATKDAPKSVHIAWSVTLKERAPAVVEFFERFQLKADEVSQLTYQISGAGRDAGAVATEWVERNASTVDAWLGL